MNQISRIVVKEQSFGNIIINCDILIKPYSHVFLKLHFSNNKTESFMNVSLIWKCWKKKKTKEVQLKIMLFDLSSWPHSRVCIYNSFWMHLILSSSKFFCRGFVNSNEMWLYIHYECKALNLASNKIILQSWS